MTIAESLEREDAYYRAHMNDNDSVTCHAPGHVYGCPGNAGGDHEEVTVKAPSDGSRCYICATTIRLGLDEWTFYDDAKGVPVLVCGKCVERGDVQETLDYTEDDFDIEGQPEFNGAFG